MSAAFPIAVLASGRGSNLAALIEAQRAGALPVAFTLVASDKADARALRIAEAHDIPTLALDPRGYASRRDYDLDLFARIAATRPALIVLAGFMRILDADAVAPWHGRMLNIHPSLLPKYRGLHTHRRALEAGDTEHGSSVHFVTAELDGGPVVAQARIAVNAGDTPETLAERLLPLEHRLLVAAVALVAAGRLVLDKDGPRLDGRPLRAPLQLQADGALAAAA